MDVEVVALAKDHLFKSLDDEIGSSLEGCTNRMGPVSKLNPTKEFFNDLVCNHEGQCGDNMRSLKSFARGSDESLKEAFVRLKRLIDATNRAASH